MGAYWCDTPDDEYDCLTHHILSVIERGGSMLDVKSTIKEELKDHFGLSGVPAEEINHTARRIWAWWTEQAKP